MTVFTQLNKVHYVEENWWSVKLNKIGVDRKLMVDRPNATNCCISLTFVAHSVTPIIFHLLAITETLL